MLQSQGLVVRVARIAVEDAASYSTAMGAWACGAHWQQVAAGARQGSFKFGQMTNDGFISASFTT